MPPDEWIASLRSQDDRLSNLYVSFVVKPLARS